MARTSRHLRSAGSGFTLVEALTVVAVLAIVTSVAAPGARQLLSSQRAKGLAYDLAADLMLARSEALKRNAGVSLSPSGSTWDQGWIVQIPTQAITLRARNAYGEALSLDGAPTTISFLANGRVGSPASQMRLTIAPASSTNGARCIDLSLSGRVRVDPGACT